MRTAWLLLAALLPVGVRADAPADLIEVDVQAVEVNKSRLLKLGLSWRALLRDATVGFGPGLVTFGPESMLVAESALLGTFDNGRLDAFVRTLQDRSAGKLLSKPKLLTVSGSPASFLVGGEIPYIVIGQNGHVTVTWKEYGMRLAIRPERRGDAIRTHVRAESSTVDPVHTVVLPNGIYMPALKTRWAEADVELANHATVIIAGLIQEEDNTITSGIPVLADLPVLGWLFRTTRTERAEMELVIFVTPSLVAGQPGPAGP